MHLRKKKKKSTRRSLKVNTENLFYSLPSLRRTSRLICCCSIISNARIYKAERAGLSALLFKSLTMFRAIHSLIAIFVIMGFTPLALGKTDASATYRPSSTSQTRPRASTTPCDGVALIRHVPIWCADMNTVSGSGRPLARTSSSQLLNAGSLMPLSVGWPSTTLSVFECSARLKVEVPGTVVKISVAPIM